VHVTPVVELEGVAYAHGEVPVLEGIDLTVAPGEFFGIIGPNGSGKTTLLRVILGLIRPQRGRVRLFGTPVPGFREWRRVGYMPQKAAVDPALPVTVAEVVATGLVSVRRVAGRAGGDQRARIEETLGLVGMDKHEGARIGALSTGQQQRVLIARALVSEPELLVLDEPTGSIDPEAQSSFYTVLRTLNRERGVTLVLVSHDIGVVASEVTRVACLNRRILFCGRPSDVLTGEALGALYGASVRLVPHRDPCAHAP
jgi:zinc transport system ATP-binding protein